ncbi:gliomedin-like isoform X2 [Centruroides sculpturatus]|uniref:gliomedin-like isoform X2 n=1 Tax=Centruroides sculpturatus TaxID=218467 RepID=UPI000C6DCF5A|nr:gliomedin-like isoform X2 [Centruroides sculpturatus]
MIETYHKSCCLHFRILYVLVVLILCVLISDLFYSVYYSPGFERSTLIKRHLRKYRDKKMREENRSNHFRKVRSHWRNKRTLTEDDECVIQFYPTSIQCERGGPNELTDDWHFQESAIEACCEKARKFFTGKREELCQPTIKEQKTTRRTDKGIKEKEEPDGDNIKGNKEPDKRKVKGETARKEKNGFIQNKGEPAEKNDFGYKGEPGTKGEPGEKGDFGDKGEPGEKGGPGKKGGLGDKGEPGTKGELGEKGGLGDKGEPGEKGKPGEKGDIGDKGKSGKSGEKGQKGRMGEKGQSGEKGSKGDPGISLCEMSEDPLKKQAQLLYELLFQHLPIYKGLCTVLTAESKLKENVDSSLGSPTAVGKHGMKVIDREKYNHEWKKNLGIRKKDCLLNNVENPVFSRFVDSDWGWWMPDPIGNNTKNYSIWFIKEVIGDTAQLHEYSSLNDFQADKIYRNFTLPYPIQGNGHIMYNGSLYYHAINSDKFIKFNVFTNTYQEFFIEDAAHDGSKYLYNSNHSYVDFEADENGLWMIFASKHSENTIVIKFDSENLKTLSKWNLTLHPQSVGEMFVACGSLYAINKVNELETTIRLVFDFYSNDTEEVEEKFVNSCRQNYLITYNWQEESLYAWDKGNLITYRLHFIDRNEW